MSLGTIARARLLRASAPAAATAVTVGLLAQASGGVRPVWPLGACLLALGVGALWWWRQRPVPVLAVGLAVAVAYYAAGFAPGPETTPFVVALVWLAAAEKRTVAAVAALVGGAVATLVDVLLGQAETAGDTAAVAGTLAALLALAEVLRMRRTAVAQRMRRAADAERLRIARELHDVVSHQLAVINLQAEAALARHETRPELAVQALSVISAASREALGDIRLTLGAIREPAETVADPVGALADLPRLIERLPAGDIAVTATIPEPPAGVPPAVQRAAVRIAQESLTNATRHARPTTVSVTVTYQPDAVELEVINDGAPGAGGAPGSGIAGMRERATALGGQLSAGPLGDGNFGVHARLPWGTR